MVSNPRDNEPVVTDLGEFLDAIRTYLAYDFRSDNHFVDTDGNSLFKVYGQLPEYQEHSSGDIEPPYEIILSVDSSESNPDKEDYATPMILDTKISAWCKWRITSVINRQQYIPLNDAHRIIHWAKRTYVPGMTQIPELFTGGVERGTLEDPFGVPDDDVTRLAYRAWWMVEFRYYPSADDNIYPSLVDDSFVFPLNNAYLKGGVDIETVDSGVGFEDLNPLDPTSEGHRQIIP